MTTSQDQLPARAGTIMDFWFFPGYQEQLTAALSQGKRIWWHNKEPEVDRRIRDLFLDDLLQASAGKYEDWKTTARGTLAFIILLDQMPRHIYRDDPRAFDYDPLALATCRAALAKGYDKELNAIKRYFFYLPLMHDESVETQSESVVLYEQLYRTGPAALKDGLKIVLNAAHRHKDIIERFGRFPHRNLALGRTSTSDELEFRKEPESSF